MEGYKTVTIDGKQLKCPFCGNDNFFEYDVKLNTFSTSFLTGLWSLLAKRAKIYACIKCGFTQQFVNEPSKH